ncbi:hypothetical protein [Rubellimicrobium roseum]|uniref:Uncharacterized protein n=1 Tax=Rubellimicrobium roseum TaxID=687525 RepID=A0A5C4NAQ1_9RHOB|nr:hypothetical protein [Rubellimicrobium roseum]TNC61042.1 hypothetical protein FHG71_21520 [Rubellimicrobium roseum]
MTDILRISGPLTLWLTAFSAVYGLQGLICSPRWAEAGLDLAAGRMALALAASLVLGLQVAFLLALRTTRFASCSGFVRTLSLGLSTVALVASAWTLIPVATTSACL